MNGIFLLIGIHILIWRTQRRGDQYFDLVARYEALDRSLARREYSFGSKSSGLDELEEALGRELRLALEDGRFRPEAWSALKSLVREWAEEIEKLGKFRVLLHSQLLIPGVSVLFLRCILENEQGFWYRPGLTDFVAWTLYALVFHLLLEKGPRHKLFHSKAMLDFLALWLGAKPRGVWAASLEQEEEEAMRWGRCPQQFRQEYLMAAWQRDKFAAQRKLLIWEQGLPAIELMLFVVLGLTLCLNPLLQFLGPL